MDWSVTAEEIASPGDLVSDLLLEASRFAEPVVSMDRGRVVYARAPRLALRWDRLGGGRDGISARVSCSGCVDNWTADDTIARLTVAQPDFQTLFADVSNFCVQTVLLNPCVPWPLSADWGRGWVGTCGTT